MTLQAARDMYASQTKQYMAMRYRGWYIVRGYSSYWTVQHGIEATGGFSEWNEALQFIANTEKLADVPVIH